MTRRLLAACSASLCSALLLTATPVPAQHRIAAAGDEVVVLRNEPAEIPFEMVNNHLLLDVRVNDSAEPVRVVLDTGMPIPGLLLYETEATRGIELDFDPQMQARVGGAGGSGHTMAARMALDESIDFGAVAFEHTRVLSIPLPEPFPAYHDGIVGYSFFGRFVVDIDYDDELIRLHQRDGYQPPPGATSLPLTLRGNLPYVTIDLDLGDGAATRPTEVVVDLGAGHALSLNDAVRGIEVPTPALEAVLGHGLSGEITGRVARVPEVRLGELALLSVVTSFPVPEHQNPRGIESLGGNLGNGILKRFDVTFDYAGKRLLLARNGASDDPFVYDHSGMRLRFGHDFAVDSVLDESPAAEAGVEPGDVLTHVGSRPVGELGIDAVRDALSRTGPIDLRFRRDGEELTRSLQLRRLL